MKSSKKNFITLHERLFRDVQRHIEGSSFGSVSAFVHHVMADIVSTGDLSMGGDIPESEAELVRKRLEVLGYIDSKEDTSLVPVHGGLTEPVNCQIHRGLIEDFVAEAKSLDAYPIPGEDLCLLYRFGDGVLSPLEGPMVRDEFSTALEEEVIVRDGTRYAWPIPIAFRLTEEQARTYKEGARLAVIDDKNDIVGIITVHEIYPFEIENYLDCVYGTNRADHAGARRLLRHRRQWLMGGKVEVLPEKSNPLLSDIIQPAWKTRELCQNRRWEKVVAFHGDGPPLRTDEFGMVSGVEQLTRQGRLTGLVLNPLISENEFDFVPAMTRIQCYRALIERRLIGKGDKDVELWKHAGYDLNDQCFLLALDMKRFYAGPREAVMHAIYRQNFGFTHLVIDPNHAGSIFDDGTPLYPALAAQEKFDHLKGELYIEPVRAEPVGYFTQLGRVAPLKGNTDKGWEPLTLSQTELRGKIEASETVDPRTVRPEVARILKRDFDLYRTTVSTNVTWHHASVTKEDREALNAHRGICIWFTGLSASGKSSVAQAVEGKLYERGIRTYVLDGDNIRHGLNANLGFSPEDREENIRRIGEVAKLFTNAGVVVMTAFISPYRKDRNQVRNLLNPGDFIEVFVDCPVAICERRDPKGLYKKARAGQIPEFTGVSAPYEAPDEPEVHLQAGDLSIEACADEVVRYLEESGVINRK